MHRWARLDAVNGDRFERRRSNGAVKVLIGLLSAVVVVVGSDLAGAHSDAGELTVTNVEQSGPNRISIEVGLVHDDDGHIADEAAVTATLEGPAGDSIGPVPLPQIDANSSLYGAELEVTGPGAWVVDVAATNPTAAISTEIDVVETAAEPSDPTTTVEGPSTTAAAGNAADTEEPLVTTAAGTTTTSDNRWLMAGAAVAAVALIAIVTLALRRRQDPDELTD